MSRCFPYPPPGYVRGGGISLVESIKLQKQKELEKERKKEKKREHREKKDKKKRSRGDYEQATEDKRVEKKRLLDKDAKSGQRGRKDLPDQKQVQFVPEEQLEKSGLTEELGLPHLPYQCGSPDSSASEDSSKRRRIDDCQKTHVAQATGLRIRFALAKPKEQEAPTVIPSNILRLSVTAPSPAVPTPVAVKPPLVRPPPVPLRREPEVAVKPPLVRPPSVPLRREPEVEVPRPSTSKEHEAAPEPPSFSGRTETTTSKLLSLSDGFGSLEGNRGSKKSRKKEAKYSELFLNWAPPPLLETGCLEFEDDQDWLFKPSLKRQPRQELQQGTGACVDPSPTASCQSPRVDKLCSWPPRACHLEDADVYALPFVVPF